MTTKEEKIEKIISEGRIFLITETPRYEYYICKGISNKVYDIIYFKHNDKWKCDCDNIRGNNCYHIESAKRVKNETKDN